MSGTVASRYIGGVPYGPGRSVGRYPNAASLGTTPGVVTNPVVAPPWVPSGGSGGGGGAVVPQQVVPQQVASTPVSASGGGGGGSGNGNLLAALLGGAGLLQYLPDIYDSLFGSPPPVGADDLPLPPEQMAPPELPAGATPMGTSDLYGQVWSVPSGQAGLTTLYDSNGRSLGSLDMTTGAFDEGSTMFDGGDLGAIDPDLWDSTTQDLGGNGSIPTSGATNWAGIPDSATQVGIDAGTIGGVDLAQSLAYAPAAVFGLGTGAFAKPGGELGGQIGSTLGGILGGIVGGPWGAALGTIGGGAIGGQIGPNPTVGRNFSTIGTFDGSGGLNWGNAGGDNGGQAGDANSFANWFSQNLAQQAAAQGLGFNPNMSGAQIRVGGYDNPSRSGAAPGGYFYDITNQGGSFGGDPDRYALRPASDFANDPYSTTQANAFAQNVLADLVARGVYTQGGQAGPDQGYLQSTLGANYGWYGMPGGNYNQFEYGGSDFNNLLTGRQNAVTGYINEQQAQRQREAIGANTAQVAAPGGGYVPAAYDLSQPIFYGNQILNPGDLGFPDQVTIPEQTNGLVDPGMVAPELLNGAYDPGGA